LSGNEVISLFNDVFKLLGPSYVEGEVEDVINFRSAEVRQFGSEEIEQLHPNEG
jgi:hypothetical protein